MADMLLFGGFFVVALLLAAWSDHMERKRFRPWEPQPLDPDRYREPRGTGRTSAQMREAPADATFVWCNGHLDYPRILAKRLGRDDLVIVGPNDGRAEDRGTGRAIVRDHALG